MEPTSKEAIYLAALKREALEKYQRENLGEDYPTLIHIGGIRFVVTAAGNVEEVIDEH